MDLQKYDVVVIGSGPGGYVAALCAAREGTKVALIEKEEIGGLCLNWGCIPSKVLLKHAAIFSRMRKMKEKGIAEGDFAINFKKLIEHSRERVVLIRGSLTRLIEGSGVKIINGSASFQAKDTLAVKLQDGQTLRLCADKGIIIAVGAKPRELQECSIDGTNIITSREALAFDELPNSLLIVGGGVIGCELATFFAALGTKVTVVEAQNQLLPNVDSDIVKALAESFKRNGIVIYLQKYIARTELGKDGVKLWLKDETAPLTAEKVLLAVGISANTAALGLDKIGVETQGRGFAVVDPETYQTNVPGIYAIGDVIALRGSASPHPALAHVASCEGEIAAEAIVKGKASWRIDYDNIPLTIFTDPEIGICGLTKEEADLRFPDHKDRIIVQKTSERVMGVALALEEMQGLTKIVIDESEFGKILGAHVLGPTATERIHIWTAVRRAGESARLMAQEVMAHPTFSEVFRESLLALDGKAVHIPLMAQAGRKKK